MADPPLGQWGPGAPGSEPGAAAASVGRELLRADRLTKYKDIENGKWKFLMWDKSNNPKMPMGSVGFRWGEEKGKWNLTLNDGVDGTPIDPELTFIDLASHLIIFSNLVFFKLSKTK